MPAQKPTFKSIEPIHTGPFSPYAQATARRQREYEATRAGWRGTKITTDKQRRLDDAYPIVPEAFDVNALVSPTAVAAIKRAFMLARTSHRNWKSGMRYGRLDSRAAARADRGATDIFKYKRDQSATQVRLAVVTDASGSMGGRDAKITVPGWHRKVTVTRHEAAALFGATIAKALGTIPTVSLDVFEHSAASGGRVEIKWRWHRGTPLGVFNEGSQRSFGTGGNADGHALMAIAKRMQRDLKRDERGLILMVSDGLPADYTPDGRGNAGGALKDAVAECRAMGIEVIAVAIEGSDQSAYYGKDGFIPFTGDWMELGRNLADHVGRALAAGRPGQDLRVRR